MEGNALVRVFRDALAESLFERFRAFIADAPAALRAELQREHWQPTGEPVSHLLAEVLAALEPLAEPGACAGAEWWTRYQRTDVEHELHFDKDEALYRAEKRLTHPARATVLYLGDAGGPTLVVDQTFATLDTMPRGAAVWPHPNQYSVFSGALRHGVLSSGEADPARERTTFLVNWWTLPLTAPRPLTDELRAAIPACTGAVAATRPFLVPADEVDLRELMESS